MRESLTEENVSGVPLLDLPPNSVKLKITPNAARTAKSKMLIRTPMSNRVKEGLKSIQKGGFPTRIEFVQSCVSSTKLNKFKQSFNKVKQSL